MVNGNADIHLGDGACPWKYDLFITVACAQRREWKIVYQLLQAVIILTKN